MTLNVIWLLHAHLLLNTVLSIALVVISCKSVNTRKYEADAMMHEAESLKSYCNALERQNAELRRLTNNNIRQNKNIL